MTPITRIKICGITRPEDALAAVEAGADAIGLVFYSKSPRSVSLQQAVDITHVVPPFVTVVALFVDASAQYIHSVLNAVPIDVIQFHGDESPKFCQQFHRPFIKAVRVRPDTDLVASCVAYSAGRGVLLDAFREGVPGGTGARFDWNLAMLDLPVPIILAGGLNHENIGEAIHALHPTAVDVSGGVECSPGVKDVARIKTFISAVKAADQQQSTSGTFNE